jgi:tRNA threonylcarbamoyladenosine biosynthesis protein TsaB
MKLLAIETATEACSAALLVDGELSECYEVQPRKQSELILAMVDALLAEGGLLPGELDGLAFGRGPGSFTGVRIAAGVAQGIAFGADIPVVPVSTLAALAQRHFRENGPRRLLPAFDARMSELYWGCYEVNEEGLVESVMDDCLASADNVIWPEGGGWHGVGSGWTSYGDRLAGRMGEDLESVDASLLCSARDLALLGTKGLQRGDGVPADRAFPVYLRDQVARKPG